MSGRCLGLEGSASLLDALKDCPLEVLDLTGNEICGIKATGTDPFNPFVLKMVCALIIKEGCALRRLRLKGNHMIGNDVYTSEAVFLFSEALRSPRCRLEELQLGLVNKSSGLREEDGMVLGTAVQACASLIKLSVTRAELPMTELLHGSISLDLEGKGLGRTEMGIAAQILRSNGTLRTLKLTDNCMGPHGLLALADAVRHARPPLEEVFMGNLGISSCEEIYVFLRALREGGAPLRVLDIHGNPLCVAEGGATASAPPPGSSGTQHGGAPDEQRCLRALAEVCDWIASPGNQLSVLNLREVMKEELPAEIHQAALTMLCAAVGHEHCVLRELNVHGFGFKPASVTLLAEALLRCPTPLETLVLARWAVPVRRLGVEAGRLTFGGANGCQEDVVLVSHLLGSDMRRASLLSHSSSPNAPSTSPLGAILPLVGAPAAPSFTAMVPNTARRPRANPELPFSVPSVDAAGRADRAAFKGSGGDGGGGGGGGSSSDDALEGGGGAGGAASDGIVRCLDLSEIGANVGSAGLSAIASVIRKGQLPHLCSVILKDTSLKKAQLEQLLRALLDGGCAVEDLELCGTELCLSAPGRFCLDALRIVCALITRAGSTLRRLGLRGTYLCGLPPGSDVGDKYNLEGIALLCAALCSEHCMLEELDVSDNGLRAEREPQPPSRLPARLYGLTRQDGPQLSALVPAVRARVLRELPYPAIFARASARGFELPPLETVANLEASAFLELWGQANEAERLAGSPASAAPARAGPPTCAVPGAPGAGNDEVGHLQSHSSGISRSSSVLAEGIVVPLATLGSAVAAAASAAAAAAAAMNREQARAEHTIAPDHVDALSRRPRTFWRTLPRAAV